MTPATGRGMIPDMHDDAPDFGDLDGLAWRVRQAMGAIRNRVDLDDGERRAWVAAIEAAHAAARGSGQGAD